MKFKIFILFIAFTSIFAVSNAQINPCGAYFTFSTISDNVLFFESLTDNSIITEYQWDFGDGSSVFQEDSVHMYSEPGIYTVCLTVWGFTQGDACTNTQCQEVVVGDFEDQCDATFTMSVDQSGVINFTTDVEYDSYSWDFGDGNTSTEGNPFNQYTLGEYSACLTVTEGQCTDTFCQDVLVEIISGVTNVNALINSITTYPNPFNNTFTIEINSNSNSEINISLTSIQGKLVYDQTRELNQGINALQVNDIKVENGIYFLKITDTKTQEYSIQRIIKE